MNYSRAWRKSRASSPTSCWTVTGSLFVGIKAMGKCHISQLCSMVRAEKWLRRFVFYCAYSYYLILLQRDNLQLITLPIYTTKVWQVFKNYLKILMKGTWKTFVLELNNMRWSSPRWVPTRSQCSRESQEIKTRRVFMPPRYLVGDELGRWATVQCWYPAISQMRIGHKLDSNNVLIWLI